MAIIPLGFAVPVLSIYCLAVFMRGRFLLQSHDLPYPRDIFFAGLGNLRGQIPKVEKFF
jgi:hypothetical protein